MSHGMSGDHVTQLSFSCISFERLQCSMKRLSLKHQITLFSVYDHIQVPNSL